MTPAGAPDTSVPKWIWVVFVTLVVLALCCFAAAIVLGGYMAPPKVTPGKFKNVEPKVEAMQPSPTVPLEMALLVPTEVPLPAHISADLPAVGEVSPLEVQPTPDAPLWVRNAAAVEVPEGAPKLALVIDDMGLDGPHSTMAVRDLPVGVTFSFLPYGEESGALALAARTAGHEILVHVPMEPVARAGGGEPEMGPHGLKVGMETAEIQEELLRNIKGLETLAVGINNHMGSRFTAWPDGMRAVLTVLQGEGMLFLDSRTIAPTAVKEASAGLDLPVLGRDVFLDHEPEAEKVREELHKAVALAKKRGFALAIGHPLPDTLRVLNEELPGIVSSGVVLVPVTAGIKR